MWLEIRGLRADGNSKEVKDRVRQYMAEEPQPEIIVFNNENTNDILTLIDVLNEMISMLLSIHTTYKEIDYLELVIRKFLNYYDKLDKETSNNDQLPSWSTQYNFLSLLNIPNIMREYGCCRNIWEGGIEDEVF